MALREAADHEQAHPAGDGGVDGGRLGQLLVDLGEVLGGEADALVVDLDQHPAVRQAGGVDQHPGLRAGERGGVLQQLGEQVDEVGHGGADDLGLGDAGQLDALVLLHLGGGGAQHVDQRHRGVPAAAGLLAREDEQVLAVAAHTGREVVQLEEVLQLVRVGLVVLQLGDQCQLALDEALAAARQVGEDRVDVPSQQRLLGGQRDRLLVHLVEGAGDLADLVLAVQRDRRDRGVHAVRVGLGELLDQVREAVVGDLQRGAVQRAHTEDHRAGDRAGQQTGDDERREHDHGVEDGVGEGAGLEARRVGDDLVQQLALGGAQARQVGGGRLLPVRRGETGRDGLGDGLVGRVLALAQALGGVLAVGGADREQALDGRRGAVGHPQRGPLLGVGLGDQRVGVDLGVLGGAAHVELGDRDLLQLRGDQELLDELGVLVAGRGVGRDADQQVHHQRALGGGGGLAQRDGVDRPALAGDVGAAEADGVVVGHQRGDHRGVGGRRGGGEQLRLVRVVAQVRQRDHDGLEGRVAPGQAGVVGDRRVRRLVGLQRLVGLGPLAGDEPGRVLADHDRRQGEVALVLQGVREPGGRAGQLGGLLGAVGLDVAVVRGVDAQTAEDQPDEDRDQQDRDQAGGHPPVARREELVPSTARLDALRLRLGLAARSAVGGACGHGRRPAGAGRGPLLGRGERGEPGGLRAAAVRLALAGLGAPLRGDWLLTPHSTTTSRPTGGHGSIQRYPWQQPAGWVNCRKPSSG